MGALDTAIQGTDLYYYVIPFIPFRFIEGFWAKIKVACASKKKNLMCPQNTLKILFVINKTTLFLCFKKEKKIRSKLKKSVAAF